MVVDKNLAPKSLLSLGTLKHDAAFILNFYLQGVRHLWYDVAEKFKFVKFKDVCLMFFSF